MAKRSLHIFLASLLFLLAGCDYEELQTEIESTDEQTADVDSDQDEDDIVDGLSCTLLDMTLVADLPVSGTTAKSDYESTTFNDWCEKNIVNDALADFVGNANAWQANESDPLVMATSPFGRATRPTLAHGARLEVHVLEPEGSLPFVRKIHFANWTGRNGTCALEMRVYQQDVGATGKKPLLYFHGGGWRHRATTMTAAEILTSHLVDNHVVFMPSYPLHQFKDGPESCRGARFEDILAIAQQAFEWVQQHKDVFGATGAEVIDVMGHSAGGQLAAWTATQNRAAVGKLVNFYGPVEFADFIDETDPGGRYETSFAQSRDLLASILSVDDLSALERPYSDVVFENSLSERVAREGAGALPPFYMVQGNADETVPVHQALHACNALGGNASASGGTFACGDDSYVAIVDGAGHNLDRRCAGGEWPREEDRDVINLMDTICPTAGGADDEVAAVAQAVFDWIGE